MQEYQQDYQECNQLIDTRHGTMLFNKNDLLVGRSLTTYGEFAENEIKLLRQLVQKNSVIIEVGSYIGTTTIPLAQWIGNKGRIFVIEPQRILYQNLCANISLNNLFNVESYQVLASDKIDWVKLPEINYHHPADFGSFELSGFDEGYLIAQVTLDSLLEINNLNLLKISVVGMELLVLKGASELINTSLPIIYIDNNDPERSQALIEYLWGLNYECYWHLPLAFNNDNYFAEEENIFPTLLSVNMLCLPEKHGKTLNGFDKINNSSVHPLKQPS